MTVEEAKKEIETKGRTLSPYVAKFISVREALEIVSKIELPKVQSWQKPVQKKK